MKSDATHFRQCSISKMMAEVIGLIEKTKKTKLKKGKNTLYPSQLPTYLHFDF
jgi:hypothetical protein